MVAALRARSPAGSPRSSSGGGASCARVAQRDPRHARRSTRPAARSGCAPAPTGSRSAATAAWPSSTTRPAPCPATRRCASGLSPQLTIEALIAERGGFDGRAGGRGGAAAVPAAQGRRARRRRGARSGAATRPAAACSPRRAPALARLVAHFDDPATAYVPVPRPEIAPALQRLRPSGPHRRMARHGGDAVSVPRRRPRRSAAPPTRRRSVWVTANAGTGKTRVLSDRVLRLLLAGADPEGILCLTFTKAAAAEMTARIEERLAAWATTADDADLAAELRGADRRAARRASGSTGRGACSRRCWSCRAGSAIMTIHAPVRRPAAPVPARGRRGAAFRDHRRAHRARADAARPASRSCARGARSAARRSAGRCEVLAVTLAESTLDRGARRSCWAQRMRSAARPDRVQGGRRGLIAAIYRALGAEPGLEPPAIGGAGLRRRRLRRGRPARGWPTRSPQGRPEMPSAARPSPPGWLRRREPTACDCSPTTALSS